MENFKNCINLLIGYLLCISIITFLTGILLYIVFGIIYLIDDNKIAAECINSSLSSYVLISLFLSLYRCNIFDIKDNKSEKLCLLFLNGIFELSMSIWGYNELWINTCDKLNKTNLWNYGLLSFIIQIITFIICIIIYPLIIYLKSNKKKQEMLIDNNLYLA